MFINIITPCTRIENLHEISRSITATIPSQNYRWLVIFDALTPPDLTHIPPNCEYYCHQDIGSIVGNAQRNFALDLIKVGYVYFNDDDTTIHPQLWNNIKDTTADFISFDQVDKAGKPRLFGSNVAVGTIDSHNFIVSHEVVGDSRFMLEIYEADGHFAVECFSKSTEHLYLNKVLSTYNKLKS